MAPFDSILEEEWASSMSPALWYSFSVGMARRSDSICPFRFSRCDNRRVQSVVRLSPLVELTYVAALDQLVWQTPCTS